MFLANFFLVDLISDEIYPDNETYNVVVVPVSFLNLYFFCSYKVYLRYTSGKSSMRVIRVPLGARADSFEESTGKKDEKVMDRTAVQKIITKSLNEDSVFLCGKCKLKAEVLPGIVLVGIINKLNVFKGKITIFMRKFVKSDRDSLYENEKVQAAAYASLVNKCFNLELDDIDCFVELYDFKDKRFLRKIKAEIKGEYIESVRKCLWDLGAIALKAKIPTPINNLNKCLKCKECDLAMLT